MPTLPSRQDLKKMAYRDLQKICKAWGVRANLKSDEMIDLLLGAQLRSIPGLTPASPPQPPVYPRSAFAKGPTSRTSPPQISSVIIHNTPGEVNQQHDITVPTTNISIDVPAAPPPIRTQKAKELQKRLGIGRPAVIGGSGPRMITRSSTMSGERRLRSSGNSKSLGITTQQAEDARTSIQPPASPAPHTRTPSTMQLTEEQTLLPSIQEVLSNFMKPLQDQIATLRAEVRRLRSLEAEVQTLGALVHQARFSQSGQETRRWEKEFGASKGSLDSTAPSTPPPNSSLGLPSGPPTLLPSPKIMTQSEITGVAPVLLGKRPRYPSASKSSPTVEGEDQSGISSPAMKRPKVSGETSADKGKEANRNDLPADKDATSTMLPPATSFLVYNDPEEEESPPPNLPLPEYYTSRSGGPSGSPRYGRLTTFANAPENQNAFNFSLLPEPLTPGPTLFLPAFPYPEPPQSPTPTGANLEGRLSNGSDRSDVFKTFGLPPPGRVRRLPSSSSITVNPNALSHPAGRQRQPSSNDSLSGFNPMLSTSGESSNYQDRDTSRHKKTMYGTELEGDTRFGDFGVEGVATGFWTGGRF